MSGLSQCTCSFLRDICATSFPAKCKQALSSHLSHTFLHHHNLCHPTMVTWLLQGMNWDCDIKTIFYTNQDCDSSQGQRISLLKPPASSPGGVSMHNQHNPLAEIWRTVHIINILMDVWLSFDDEKGGISPNSLRTISQVLILLGN